MKVELLFFGIRATLESDDQEFINTASDSLRFFSRHSDKNPALFNESELTVSYKRARGSRRHWRERPGRKIGNNAYFYKNRYMYYEGDHSVEIEWKNNCMCVEAERVLPKDIRRAIKRSIIGHRINYFLLVRKLVIFPIFYMLERKYGVFLLHSSAMDYDGKAVAVAGLAGVGKSTCAIALTLQSDGKVRYLTDNFMLFDGNHVYPFPEYIRLHDDSVRYIGDITRLGEPVMRRYRRNYYLLDPNMISGVTKPKIVLMPVLSEKEYVKALPIAVAMDRLMLANDHVKEFHNYHHMGLLGFCDLASESTYKQKMAVLEAFLQKNNVYEVGVCTTERPLVAWDRILGRVL